MTVGRETPTLVTFHGPRRLRDVQKTAAENDDTVSRWRESASRCVLIQPAESEFRKNGAVLVNVNRGTPFLVKFHGPRCLRNVQKTAAENDKKVSQWRESTSRRVCDLARGVRFSKKRRRAREREPRDAIFGEISRSAMLAMASKNSAS